MENERIFNSEDYLNSFYLVPEGHKEENVGTTPDIWTNEAMNMVP